MWVAIEELLTPTWSLNSSSHHFHVIMQRWEGEADLGTWKTVTKKTSTFLSPLLLFTWMVGQTRRRQMAMMVSLVPVLQTLLNWKSEIKSPFIPCLSPPLILTWIALYSIFLLRQNQGWKCCQHVFLLAYPMLASASRIALQYCYAKDLSEYGLVHDEWQHYWPMKEQANVPVLSGWEPLYLTSGCHVQCSR